VGGYSQMGYPPTGYPQTGYPQIGYSQGYPPQFPVGGPPQTVIVQNGFDAGARFDGASQPNVPVNALAL